MFRPARCLRTFKAAQGHSRPSATLHPAPRLPFYRASRAGLLHLARLQHLTGLDLGYSCWGHSAAGLEALLRRLPRLEMLNIGGCEGASDAVLAAVAGLSQLTQLDVSECQRVTQGCVIRPAQRCTMLRWAVLGSRWLRCL